MCSQNYLDLLLNIGNQKGRDYIDDGICAVSTYRRQKIIVQIISSDIKDADFMLNVPKSHTMLATGWGL